MSKTLSEGITWLKFGHNSAGVCIHKAMNHNFITITALKAHNLEDRDFTLVENVENQIANEKFFRITIGANTYALVFSESVGIIASKLPIYTGEEVWVTCSNPGKYVMYGIVENMKE